MFPSPTGPDSIWVGPNPKWATRISVALTDSESSMWVNNTSFVPKEKRQIFQEENRQRERERESVCDCLSASGSERKREREMTEKMR